MGVSPVSGGVNTEWDPAQLPLGSYSNVENVRQHGPGFKLRPGLNVRNSLTLASPVISMFSYGPSKRVYSQHADGSIQMATRLPPAQAYNETWGTEVWDSDASLLKSDGDVIPGSWSEYREAVIHSNGKDQHLIYPGKDARPSQIQYAPSLAAPAHYMLESGMDARQVQDFMTDPGAKTRHNYYIEIEFDSDSGLAICTDFPAYEFNFKFSAPCIWTPVHLKWYAYHGLGTTGPTCWIEMTTGVTDNTAKWTQSGTVVQTQAGRNTDMGVLTYEQITEMPSYHFGRTGYWYYFAFQNELQKTSFLKFDSISYTGPWMPLQNVPNGQKDYAVEVQVDDSTDQTVYPGDTVDITAMASGTYIYAGFAEKPMHLYIDPTSPNTATGKTLTVEVPHYRTGWSTWYKTDNTGGFEFRGWVSMARTWRRYYQQMKRSINGSLELYWVRMKLNAAVTGGSTILSIQGVSEHDNIEVMGQSGYCSTVWKDRGCFTFSRLPRDIYVSAKYRPNVLNGDDFAILTPGDGRYNQVTAMLPFYNELMVFQSEEGSDGGCLTLFEGYSPETFGKLVLSTRLGTFNAQSVAIIDGSKQTTRTTDVTQTQVAFISKYGVFITDGRTIKTISEPIQNYFDPENDEYIRTIFGDGGDSKAIQHWISYDRQSNVLRLGLITGKSSDDFPDVFPVYHLNTGEWTFDVYPSHRPTAFAEVTAATGNVDSLQFMAACEPDDSDVMVYMCVSGQDWDMNPYADPTGSGTKEAIQGKLRWEFSNGGNYVEIKELVLRASTISDYTLTKKVYENGVLDSTHTVEYDMDAVGSELTYRVRMLESIQLNSHFSVEITWSNTADPEAWGSGPILYDIIHEINSSPNLD